MIKNLRHVESKKYVPIIFRLAFSPFVFFYNLYTFRNNLMLCLHGVLPML